MDEVELSLQYQIFATKRPEAQFSSDLSVISAKNGYQLPGFGTG